MLEHRYNEKKKCQSWRDELKNQAKFKQFYNFVFDYLKEEKKILSKNAKHFKLNLLVQPAMEEATTVWEMLGVSDKWPLYRHWAEFVKDKKSISRDTWRLFLNFIEQYPKDVSTYDADSCWPSVLDEVLL